MGGWTHPTTRDTRSTRQYGLSNNLPWEAAGEEEASGTRGPGRGQPLCRAPRCPP